MEIEVLLDLIELILSQKGEVEDFVEDIIKKNFVLDEGTLFIATQMRQIELVRFVLKSGVKPTLDSFQYAAEHEFFELCRLFVKFGSRKILSTPELEEQLRMEYLDNNLEEAKKLVNLGVDPTANKNFLIRISSQRGHFEFVKFLLEQGADPTDVDNHAISLASGSGHLEIVRLLLKYGADPTADNNAIRKASGVYRLEIIELLQSRGTRFY
jgi:ankyrin repeat protein